MKVYINKDGFLKSPEFQDANIELEITSETWAKISSCKIFYNWKYEEGEWNQVCINESEYLKKLRERQCFNIIDNRSILWYNSLTKKQLEELEIWYKAWLDVTDTKKIPDKPTWLT